MATATASTATIGAGGSTAIMTIHIEMTKKAKRIMECGTCLKLVAPNLQGNRAAVYLGRSLFDIMFEAVPYVFLAGITYKLQIGFPLFE